MAVVDHAAGQRGFGNLVDILARGAAETRGDNLRTVEAAIAENAEAQARVISGFGFHTLVIGAAGILEHRNKFARIGGIPNFCLLDQIVEVDPVQIAGQCQAVALPGRADLIVPGPFRRQIAVSSRGVQDVEQIQVWRQEALGHLGIRRPVRADGVMRRDGGQQLLVVLRVVQLRQGALVDRRIGAAAEEVVFYARSDRKVGSHLPVQFEVGLNRHQLIVLEAIDGRAAVGIVGSDVGGSFAQREVHLLQFTQVGLIVDPDAGLDLAEEDVLRQARQVAKGAVVVGQQLTGNIVGHRTAGAATSGNYRAVRQKTVGIQAVLAGVVVGVGIDLVVDRPAVAELRLHADVFEIGVDVVKVVVVEILLRRVVGQHEVRAIGVDLRLGGAEPDVLVDLVVHRHHRDLGVVADRPHYFQHQVAAGLAVEGQVAVAGDALAVDEGGGVAVLVQFAGVELDAALQGVEAAAANIGIDFGLRRRRLGVERDGAAEGGVADGLGAAGTAVDHDVTQVVRHEVRRGVVGEVVGVAPGNAVQGDVVLPVLEATDAKVAAFLQAWPVGSDRKHARRDLHDVIVVAARRDVVLDVLLADHRGGLRCLERCLARGLVRRRFDLLGLDLDAAQLGGGIGIGQCGHGKAGASRKKQSRDIAHALVLPAKTGVHHSHLSFLMQWNVVPFTKMAGRTHPRGDLRRGKSGACMAQSNKVIGGV